MFPITSNTICIFDCCNSATIGDLEYTYQYNATNKTTQITENRTTKGKKRSLENSIISIAGCKDEQISNVVLTDKGWNSALTTAIIEIFSTHSQELTLHQLEMYLHEYMIKNELFEQTPVISSSWAKKPGSLISLKRSAEKRFITREAIEHIWLNRHLPLL